MNRLLSLSLGTIISLICVQSNAAEIIWLPPRDYTTPNSAPAAGAHSSNSPTKFETVPPNEAGQIAEIVSLTTQLLQQRYPEGMARRAVHPKDHGCVKAAFAVNSDLPGNYRVGIFAMPGKTFDA